jgi:hypothetical protein
MPARKIAASGSCSGKRRRLPKENLRGLAL